MVRTNEPLKVAFSPSVTRLVTLIVVALVFCSPAWGQIAVKRHQRIAASILRRKAASDLAAKAKSTTAALPQKLPNALPVKKPIGLLQEALPDGIIEPPPALGSGVSNFLDGSSPIAPEAMPSPSIPAPLTPAPVEARSIMDAPPAINEYPVEYPAAEYPIDSGGVPGQVIDPVPVESYPAQAYPTETYSQPIYPEASYPVTPHQPLTVPAAPVYSDPFSTPITSPVYSDSVGCDAGCTGACGGGCASGPGCGLPGIGGGCASAGCAGGCGGGCGGGGAPGCLGTLSLFGGVHGFKNGVNRGSSGSFGFQEGFNVGTPFNFSALGMQSQIGFRATQTDFNGANFTADSRAQYFVTGGFFKRAYNGWQGGFVIDYLHDDWYTTIDIGQLRGELSYAVPNGSSVGFMFTTELFSDDTTAVLNGVSIDEEWETLDYYAFFYEVQSNHHRRGQWRVWVGLSGESDGIIGSDFKLPMAGTWSLEPEFTYVIPDEATGSGARAEESWNVAVNLVWYPGRAFGDLNYRRLPMFDVAGNGSLVTRRR